MIFTSVFAQGDSREEESLFVAKKAFEDGFYDVSLGLSERFLRNFPNSDKTSEVNLLIGECYFYQNKFPEALRQFEGLLDKPSAGKIQDAVFYWMAEVYFRGNNFTKAAGYYKIIISNFPKSSYLSQAYYSTGWCLFQEQLYREALQYFRDTQKRFPEEPLAKESSFKVIECLYNIKDYSAMKEVLKSYAKIYPKDSAKIPYLNFYLAEADYYLGNFEEAIKEYSKVLSSLQDDKMIALSKLGIGWAYLKLRRYRQAQETFALIVADNLEKASRDTLLLGEAMAYSEEKRFQEAEKIYDELLKTTSDIMVLIQAYLGKADTLYNNAKYKEAIAIYKEALGKVSEGLPQDLVDRVHYGMGWSYLKEGLFKEAIEEFRKVAKQSEEKTVKISALCQIGDAYQDSGDYALAIETYSAILKDYPDSLYSDYVQYQLGISLLKSAKYEGAIMAFQVLKKNYPNSKLLDDASYAEGLSYFQRENYQAAKEIFEKFQAEFKDSSLRPDAMYLLGTSLYNLGKFPEAIEVYKNIARTYSHDSGLIQKSEYEIADCYYQMGNEKEAMSRFKMLRTKYPYSDLTSEIVWWLGEYYYRHDDLTLAQRYFSSLIQDFPKTNLVANAYYALGSIFQEESENEKAIENFKKVIELGKTDLAAQAAIAIADIYVRQEKFDLALDSYEKVLKGSTNLADLIYPKMAEVYRKIGNFTEAIALYRKSLDVVLGGQMGNLQFKIAETMEAGGKFDQAIEEYLKTTYLYAQDNQLVVKSLLRVAAIYEGKENFKAAVDVYKKITAMNVQEAKYAQERIEWIKTQLK